MIKFEIYNFFFNNEFYGYVNSCCSLEFSPKSNTRNIPFFCKSINQYGRYLFEQAMDTEHFQLNRLLVLVKVYRPVDINVIESTKACKVKINPRGCSWNHKAQSCLRGYQQMKRVKYFETCDLASLWSKVKTSKIKICTNSQMTVG